MNSSERKSNFGGPDNEPIKLEEVLPAARQMRRIHVLLGVPLADAERERAKAIHPSNGDNIHELVANAKALEKTIADLVGQTPKTTKTPRRSRRTTKNPR